MFMKQYGRSSLLIALFLFADASAVSVPAYAAEAVTDATGTGPLSKWPNGGRPNDIDFVRSDIVQSERLARSGSVPLEVVSLNRDVLNVEMASRRAVTFSGTPGLEIRSVICVRYKPEMLGLWLKNNGPSPAGGVARVEVNTPGNTTDFYTRLPMIGAGDSRHVLLSSSDALNEATAIALHLLP